MTWQEALQDYYNGLKPEQQQWLRKRVLWDAPLLTEIEDTETLIALFRKNGKLVHTTLFRTLVWQTLGLILVGAEKPIESNIRGFWYDFVDPLYSRHKLYDKIRADDPSYRKFLERVDQKLLRGPQDRVKQEYTHDLNEQTFQEFVLAGIFKYSGPFKFTKSDLALIGRGTASIVLVCEKEGLFDLIRQAHDEHDISVMCSNGNPSTLSLEQFTDKLKAKKIVNVSMGCLVDYDPKGYEIAEDFRRKFQLFNLKLRSFTILTSLELFTENTLAEDSYTLPKSEGKAAKAWFEKTGGINGEKRGIHLNKASKPRIRKAWTKWIEEEKED